MTPDVILTARYRNSGEGSDAVLPRFDAGPARLGPNVTGFRPTPVRIPVVSVPDPDDRLGPAADRLS